LQAWIARIAAKKSALIYDTCESGSLTANARVAMAADGRMATRDGIEQLDRDRALLDRAAPVVVCARSRKVKMHASNSREFLRPAPNIAAIPRHSLHRIPAKAVSQLTFGKGDRRQNARCAFKRNNAINLRLVLSFLL